MTPTLAVFLALLEEKPRNMSSRLQQEQADPQIKRFEGLYFTRLSTFLLWPIKISSVWKN
jgi:hypothetical protein